MIRYCIICISGVFTIFFSCPFWRLHFSTCCCMEHNMMLLHILSFSKIPTIVDYKGVLLKISPLERRTAHLYSFICELSLLSTGLCMYSPARLSAAALLLAKVLHKQGELVLLLLKHLEGPVFPSSQSYIQKPTCAHQWEGAFESWQVKEASPSLEAGERRHLSLLLCWPPRDSQSAKSPQIRTGEKGRGSFLVLLLKMWWWQVTLHLLL